MTSSMKILVVDDIPFNVKLLADMMTAEGYNTVTAASGTEALERIKKSCPDLVLLDIKMPGMNGYEVCRRLKENEATRDIPVIFVTAQHEIEDEARGFEAGAVDYITKPVSQPVVIARVRTHLALYNQNRVLEEKVQQRTVDLREALRELAVSRDKIKQGYIDTVLRLTVVAEFKDKDTASHLKRVGEYCKLIADRMGLPEDFKEAIYYASPMHDIGKISIPSDILLKTDKLTPEEFALMKTHTTVGGKILNGSVSGFIQMSEKIALSHHERWDGGGYPKGLKGEEIPLEGSLMCIADQYDALRSKRPYKPALGHDDTVDIIVKGDGRTMPGHFAPNVLETFRNNHNLFNEIYEKYND